MLRVENLWMRFEWQEKYESLGNQKRETLGKRLVSFGKRYMSWETLGETLQTP